MSHKHERTLNRIFAHPIDMNIGWRDVVHLMESLGGELEHSKHGQLKIRLGELEQCFGMPHREHTISSRETVMRIRRFLEAAGHTPPA